MVEEADGGCRLREVEDERKEPQIFGTRYGLPKSIAGHQNYFLWGPRGP